MISSIFAILAPSDPAAKPTPPREEVGFSEVMDSQRKAEVQSATIDVPTSVLSTQRGVGMPKMEDAPQADDHFDLAGIDQLLNDIEGELHHSATRDLPAADDQEDGTEPLLEPVGQPIPPTISDVASHRADQVSKNERRAVIEVAGSQAAPTVSDELLETAAVDHQETTETTIVGAGQFMADGDVTAGKDPVDVSGIAPYGSMAEKPSESMKPSLGGISRLDGNATEQQMPNGLQNNLEHRAPSLDPGAQAKSKADTTVTQKLDAAAGSDLTIAPEAELRPIKHRGHENRAEASKADFESLMADFEPPKPSDLQNVDVPRKATGTARPQLVANVMDQLQAHDLDDGLVTIKLKPHGMGLLEVEITKNARGQSEVVLRVQNPMVLDALRAETGAMSSILGSDGKLSLELFTADRGRQQQRDERQADPAKGTAETAEDEHAEISVRSLGQGLLI